MRGRLYSMDGAPPQDETGKRVAEMAETPCKNGVSDSSTISIISKRAAPAALRRSAWRALAEMAESVT